MWPSFVQQNLKQKLILLAHEENLASSRTPACCVNWMTGTLYNMSVLSQEVLNLINSSNILSCHSDVFILSYF